MKIKFNSHKLIEREVEITQQELFQLFQMMKQAFEDHITYGTFDRPYYLDNKEKAIGDYCKSHSVDIEYDKDRIAFFTAILSELKNPYQ